MEQRILLNLGQGDWQTGFASVTAQLWENDQPPIQFVGSLPPMPQLATHYQHWQQLYTALYGFQDGWRRGASDFEFEPAALTNVSQHEFETLCTTLRTELNQWLMSPTFAPIERRLRTQLAGDTAIQVMLTAHAKSVLRFPWRLWHLFEDYANAELSLSLPDYSRAPKQVSSKLAGVVRILAVLGNDAGIDVETDRQILAQLPHAQVTLLVQPTLTEWQHQLWESNWDILFFAGHSTSQGPGYLQVNSTESLTIEQLKYALRQAVKQGLQLAIFNSCDGLELAWALADLQLPQTIVMREPVPDAIAHQFLKHFLTTLASGQSLYRSVRKAREKLHGLPPLGTCASWLPVIVQNPAEIPPTWQTLMGQDPAMQLELTAPSTLPTPPPSAPPLPHPPKRTKPYAPLLLTSLTITTITFALRWFGLLQGLELQAYDALMKLRPYEAPDSRLVVVTVDEADIQNQPDLDRRGSLSDETLHQALTMLLQFEPRLIGLDIYRDFPTQTSALAKVLAQPNVVGICKSRDPLLDKVGIGSPPEMAQAQVGFSDFVEETDGVLRRQLLTLTPDPVSPCTTPYGFAALLAIYYLQGEGIDPKFTEQGHFQLGDVVFPRLPRRAGGLQRMDNGGNQILLHYRALSSPDQIAATVPLQQLLKGQVNPQSIRDRIVILGVTAPSGGDYWSTPYGIQAQDRTSGVYLQAQMVSQLISAVLDGRPLIWVWPPWVDLICYLLAAIVGSVCAYVWKSSQLIIVCLLIPLGFIVGAWAMLLTGGWFPLIPTFVAFGGSAIATTFIHGRGYAIK